MTDPRQEKELQARRQGAVYQGAFEAVIAILISAGIGYWLDGYLDTAPVLLLIGIVVGFVSFTVRLIRLGRWMKGALSSSTGESKEKSEK